MSIKPEEFNVFKIPHSRMKQLVKSCNQNVSLESKNNLFIYLDILA